MEKVIIYHNPRCSKSRQALEILESKGFKPTIIEYLKTPPDKKGLKYLLSLLGIHANALIRKNEAVYKELKLTAESPEDELIEAMAMHPILIERPIVIVNNKATIGRPPEKILEIV